MEVAPDGAAALDLLRGGTPTDLVVLDLMLPKRMASPSSRPRGSAASPPGADPHRARQRRRQGARAGSRRRRLSDEAVRLRRVPGPRSRPAAPRRGRRRAAPAGGRPDAGPGHARGRAGQPAHQLTTREYALLEYFLRNAGRVCSRGRCWPSTSGGWTSIPRATSSTCTSATSAARSTVRTSKRLIHTVRGAGYVLRADEP